jgi:hypothetical protein
MGYKKLITEPVHIKNSVLRPLVVVQLLVLQQINQVQAALHAAYQQA